MLNRFWRFVFDRGDILLEKIPRPFKLIFATVIWLAFCFAVLELLGSPTVNDLLHPDMSIKGLFGKDKDIGKLTSTEIALLNFQANKWRSLMQAAVVVIGLPTAFCLWHSRPAAEHASANQPDRVSGSAGACGGGRDCWPK
jgi:hypothetical protein